MVEEICGLCNRTIALVEGTNMCENCYDTAEIMGNSYENNLKVFTDKQD